MVEFEAAKPLKFAPLDRPLWTEHKAALVARYLYYFVFITKHGTYVDAFAGRQSEGAHEGWTVEEVLKNEPPWLRTFYLFERSAKRVEELERLPESHPKRHLTVIAGDSNIELPKVLPVGSLKSKEASFCLLDQRTFECRWDTCRHVAQLKLGGYKVEQFYFLAQGWLDRAIAGSKTTGGRATIDAWWGDGGWDCLSNMAGLDRAREFARKFREDLGYVTATPWPIYDGRNGSRRVMYYMIHATDHLAAPSLMRRAYEWAVEPTEEPIDQLALDWDGDSLDVQGHSLGLDL